jgi:PAS domain S-box-containing protein
LLIGAYRQNEVDERHPLTQKLEIIRKTGAPVREVKLTPLTRDAVQQFIADAVRCKLARAAPLAQLMHEKTGGNPFFLIQFLYSLVEEGLLAFNHGKAHWRWDLGRIHAKGYTENVADLMIDRLSALSNATRTALLELACLGDSAEVTTLTRARGTTEQQVHANLAEAVRHGLIDRLDDSYRFAHDRIREAAYALRPDEDKPSLHLRIGIALAASVTPNETSECLYLVANQLNRGLIAVASEVQREQIIAINLAAGKRARIAVAYDAAIIYLDVASKLLGEKSHPRCGPTAFAVALLRAECEFLMGHPDVAEAQLLVLSGNCLNLQASAEVTRLQAHLYTTRAQYERAVDVCLGFLRRVQIDLKAHPTRQEVDEERNRLQHLAEELTDERLHALRPMSDPDHLSTMAVFSDLVVPAFLTDRNLSDIMLLIVARLTLQHGICAEACHPLVCSFAVLAVNAADTELGFRLSHFGAVLADQHPQSRFSGRALFSFGCNVAPWVRPIRTGRPFIERGLENLLAAGDLAFAAHAYRALLAMRLFCGDPLREVSTDSERAPALPATSGFEFPAEDLANQRNLLRNLMGHEENGFEMLGAIEPYPHEGTQPSNAFTHYVGQIQLNVLAGRHDVALGFAERADKFSWCMRAYSEFTEYRFYTGLAHAAAYDVSQPELGEAHLSALREQHRKFTTWTARVPENFAARRTLLAAEIARIEGRDRDAEQLYEAAIELAREAGFVHIEAISAERAARFYEARGIRTFILSYLTLARDCYLRWGADAKVRQLDELHPHLRRREPVLGSTSTIGAPIERLDLATVLKVSEAVSGEIVLDKIVDTLLRTAIEHAGAERGLLICPQSAELRIRAEATTVGTSVAIGQCDLPISGAEIPESIVRYAARTQESVILDDASSRNEFPTDAYIRRKHVRSVLCLPLIKQGKSVALLYLEHNGATRVFTPARVAVLKFLASEAATSLENARLYRELQERESRIHRLVDSNIIGICIFGPGDEVIDANHSFLETIGYDRQDLVAGRVRWTQLTPPEWRDASAHAQAEMEMTGAVQRYEKEYSRRDGSRVPVLIGAAAFDEQRDRGVAFVVDMSERKRAEAEARESEARYREVQLELVHANRVAVTGLLTASIAHEVNQPTTAAVASAEAALRWLDRDPPELQAVRRSLVRVVENGIRASEVIDRVRDLIKKKPKKEDRLAINSVVGEVIELTQVEAARKQVSVHIAFAEGLPDIVGDRVELQQVAVNLILNAIEAMSGTTEGPRELLIRTALADRDSVLVAVMDSGPGLPLADLERFFEPFFTTKSGGLGIGLPICRSIIEAHGGRLWGTANESRGATFQFTVPTKGDAQSH